MRPLVLAAALLALAAPLAAQDTAAVRSLSTRQKIDADSIAKRSTSAIIRRQASRMKARSDSIVLASAIVAAVPVPVPPAPKPDTAPTPMPPVVTPPVVTPPAPVPLGKFIGVAQVAELPRDSVDVTPPTASRAVKVCANACSLDAAIQSARPGDELLLVPGATYPLNVTLPNKGGGTAWVTIRTDTVLSLTGTRMTPTDAARLRLAKILTTSTANEPLIVSALGANHYRFVGVEMTVGANVTSLGSLIQFGTDERTQTLATMSHHFVIDRSYVHGNAVTSLAHLVVGNAAYVAVVNSWLSEAHGRDGDSQPFAAWNGPGPFRIENNEMEMGHEGLIFGGGTFTIANGSPSDAIIRGNHFYRPLANKGVWPAKNLIESKHIKRELIEGNVFEGNWSDGQEFAVNLKSVNQDNDNPWTTSEDITMRYNRFKNVASCFAFAGTGGDNLPDVLASRITVYDNVCEGVNVAPYTGEGIAVQVINGIRDVAIFHNTIQNAAYSGKFLSMVGVPMPRFTFAGNALYYGQYGIATDQGYDAAGLAKLAPGAFFSTNVIVGGNCGTLPPTTSCPIGMPATLPIAFDGRPAGADLARVNAATAGAVVAP